MVAIGNFRTKQFLCWPKDSKEYLVKSVKEFVLDHIICLKDMHIFKRNGTCNFGKWVANELMTIQIVSYVAAVVMAWYCYVIIDQLFSMNLKG